MSTRLLSESRELTRRRALQLLGLGAAVGTLGPLTDVPEIAAAGQRRPVGQPTFPRGSVIRTVLEDVSPDRITGATLIHEHLSMGYPEWAPEHPTTFSDDLDLMSDEVKACARDGVSCIVDTGTSGLGRKIEALRTIATRSGMYIVACGGLHAKSDYPPGLLQKTEEQMADDLQKLAAAERWGAIGEMGTGTAVPMDPDEQKGFRAAALLHARTGLAIITHTSDGCVRCAMDQVDLFEAAGVPLNRVVIGHLNDVTDQPAAVVTAIAKRGAYVGFDHSGRPDDPRAPEYVRIVLALLDAGFGDRLCLSSDFGRAKYLRKNGGPGIDMAVTQAAPQLRKAGVDDATLQMILADNPRRVLAFVPPSH